MPGPGEFMHKGHYVIYKWHYVEEQVWSGCLSQEQALCHFYIDINLSLVLTGQAFHLTLILKCYVVNQYRTNYLKRSERSGTTDWFAIAKISAARYGLMTIFIVYPQTSNNSHTLEGNKYVDHSNVGRRCSIYIFIRDLTPSSSGLGKDNRKTRRETFKFRYLVRLISEVWRQHPFSHSRYVVEFPYNTVCYNTIMHVTWR